MNCTPALQDQPLYTLSKFRFYTRNSDFSYISISCVMFTDPQLWDHRQGPLDGSLMMDPDVSVLLHCAVWRGLLESQVQVELSERLETIYYLLCVIHDVTVY